MLPKSVCQRYVLTSLQSFSLFSVYVGGKKLCPLSCLFPCEMVKYLRLYFLHACVHACV